MFQMWEIDLDVIFFIYLSHKVLNSKKALKGDNNWEFISNVGVT